MKYLINSISGIWNSYGNVPAEGEGVKLYLSFDPGVTSHGSLIDLLKIDPSPREIGKIADYKKISELVVLLPMVEKSEREEESVTTTSTEINCNECTQIFNINTETTSKKFLLNNFYYTIEDDAYLFKINEDVINKILNVTSYKNYTIFQIKDILNSRANLLNLNNSVVKLMFSMINYYFPRHLNWLFDKSIPPIAMYVGEFNSTLQKQDLSNIWQGTMPSQAMNPEEEEIEIEHFLNSEEIFGGYDINDIENLTFSVFKCKKIALSSYEDVKIVNKIPENKQSWYNYNWPYDNFSLVELLKVEAGEVHDFKNDGSLEYGVLKEQIIKTITSGSTSYAIPVK